MLFMDGHGLIAGRALSIALWAMVPLCTASVPASAQNEMRTVTDPETGCVYFIYGSTLTPRLRRDGLPDCPDSARRQRTREDPAPNAEPSTPPGGRRGRPGQG